jgi:hypothetical protein
MLNDQISNNTSIAPNGLENNAQGRLALYDRLVHLGMNPRIANQIISNQDIRTSTIATAMEDCTRLGHKVKNIPAWLYRTITARANTEQSISMEQEHDHRDAKQVVGSAGGAPARRPTVHRDK